MSELNSAFAALPASPKMPAPFVGHGNPMNGVEGNLYSRVWREIGDEPPNPRPEGREQFGACRGNWVRPRVSDDAPMRRDKYLT